MYNQEYGVVLPGLGQQNPMDTFWQMRQYNDKQALIKQQQAKEQQERDDSLMKWTADQLDYKNFATGTALDPVINTSLGNLLRDAATKIKENPNLSMASLLYGIQDGVGRVASYSQKAKNMATAIDASLKEYAKDPSIDAAQLGKLAKFNAFMVKDPQTGQYRVRNAEELDDQTDHTTKILNETPWDVVTGSKALDMLHEGAKPQDYEWEQTRDNNGVMRTQMHKGKYYSYNDLVDARGNVVDGKSGAAAGVRVRGEQLLGKDGKPVAVNGQPLMMADKSDLSYFTGTIGARAALAKRAKEMGVDPRSEEGLRVALFDYLNSNNRGFINQTKDDVKQDPWRAQYDMFGKLISQLAKDKEVDVDNNPLVSMVKGMQGDDRFRTPAQERVIINGKTSVVSGYRLTPGAAVKGPNGEVYDDAFVENGTGRLIMKRYVKDKVKATEKGDNGNDKTVVREVVRPAYTVVDPGKVGSFLTSHVWSNGLKPKNIDPAINRVQSGQPKAATPKPQQPKSNQFKGVPKGGF